MPPKGWVGFELSEPTVVERLRKMSRHFKAARVQDGYPKHQGKLDRFIDHLLDLYEAEIEWDPKE